MKKRSLITLLITAILAIALTSAVTTQAASPRETASFGLLMKPGWGGTNAAMKDGNIALLKCVLQHTGSTRAAFPASTYVYTNAQGISCAKVPLGFWVWPAGVKYDPAWEQPGAPLGVPIPNSWP
jgi:hypothetical protein